MESENNILFPERIQESHIFDWIFILSLSTTLVAAIIKIFLTLKKTSPEKIIITDFLLFISSGLLLFYHYKYRWEFWAVLIIAITFFVKFIHQLLYLFKIKNIF